MDGPSGSSLGTLRISFGNERLVLGDSGLFDGFLLVLDGLVRLQFEVPGQDGGRCRPNNNEQNDGGAQAGNPGIALAPAPDALDPTYWSGPDRLALQEMVQVFGHCCGAG